MKKRILTLIFMLFLAIPLMVSCANDNNDDLPNDSNDDSSYQYGTYEVTSSLSCYINAMGGVEFGGPLLTKTILTTSEEGETLTLYLTKSTVTIYSISCYTFVDISPTSTNEGKYEFSCGTIGYYNNDVFTTEGVSYTLSSDTATNPKGEEVNYVNSITFPINNRNENYNLTLYINSQVMGAQFCLTNSVNDSSVSATPATLTVDFSNLVKVDLDSNIGDNDNTNTPVNDDDNDNSSKDDNLNTGYDNNTNTPDNDNNNDNSSKDDNYDSLDDEDEIVINEITLEEGTYALDSNLSCFIPAMGGVEFAEGLYTGSTIKVVDGVYYVTLTFTKGLVTIYSITCNTYIDANPSSDDEGKYVFSCGTIGYYLLDGTFTTEGVTYTEKTRDDITYVDSITLELSELYDSYNLCFYLNSNVMGKQFCNQSSVKEGVSLNAYQAIFTIDGDSIVEVIELDEGTYTLDSNLSCFILAMGGVEFAEGLYTGANLEVKNGKYYVTLTFTQGLVTIYNITCNTYIDTNPSTNLEGCHKFSCGTIGYYLLDGSFTTEGVSYTKSVLNNKTYVDSITLELDYLYTSLNLSFYLNSNVMGIQFCNSSSIVEDATINAYPSVFTIDTNSITLINNEE